MAHHGTVQERLKHALVRGILDHIEEDTEEAMAHYAAVAGNHRRPADGWDELCGRPVRLREDVPAAGGQKRQGDEKGGGGAGAVDAGGESQQSAVGQSAVGSGKKVLLATVKGDVHDIGKNIVGVVLGCNNYEVIDLG